MQIESLCTSDVVVDTNVLENADDAKSRGHAAAVLLLAWLDDDQNGVTWMLDDQGKQAPDLSTSLLATEYQRTLGPGSYSLVLFARCLASGRVGFAPRPGLADRKKIVKLIPRNKADRAVLGAAVLSVTRPDGAWGRRRRSG